MNFLAHLYLSGDNEKVMVGNFIGDFVKGRQFEAYEPDIRSGILLHRSIDEFTDQHPQVLKSKRRLWDKYRHYAGVIVDMFYDHFLAVNWPAYHEVPLKEYSLTTYNTITSYDPILPKGVKYMLPYMINGNWLLNYSRKEGINRALTGMSRRTTFDSHMENAVEDLTLHYADFENEFLIFFPEIREFSGKWLQQARF